MTSKNVFRVIFHNHGKIYEVYAKSVNQGSILGFVEIGELLFGEKSSVVLDPTEEKLKAEFQDVTRSYIPMHSVIRIDEVVNKGTNKILPAGEGDGKVAFFPSPILTPKRD